MRQLANLDNFTISNTNELDFYAGANTPENLFGYLNIKGWLIFGITYLISCVLNLKTPIL